ncbi:MAG TPA: phosphatase domain-containing protein [Ardenticatenaceae bacterium]
MNSKARRLLQLGLAMGATTLLAPPVRSLRRALRVRDTEKRVARFATRVERQFDRAKDFLGDRFGQDPPPEIITYRGYGTADRVYLKGRVLEAQGFTPSALTDSRWRNLRNTLKHFETDEIPGARLRARFQGDEQEVVTDEEGYFEVWLQPTTPLPTDRLWHEIEVELLSPLVEGGGPAHTAGYVLVPPPSTRFGIISDIDDTIVHTNATSLLKMARTVFLGNPHTRLPFEGVAAFYEALQAGARGTEFNPLFYVSSSPWNFYDLINEFLEVQDIPVGPLMLRDWGLSNEEVLPNRHAPHKVKSIRQILDTFPDLPFILIGDSGQEDPEIYSRIVRETPSRIFATYIRNVNPDPARAQAIVTLASEVLEAGSTLILVDDTLAAAKHAAEQGWISPDALPRVEAKTAEDQGQPSDEAPSVEVTTPIVIEGDATSSQPGSTRP